MDRRSALQRVALLMGGTVVGAELFLSGGCKTAPKGVADLFSEDSISLFSEIAETILPATATPGAKAAGVGEFIPVMVRDCYSPEEQKAVLDGLLDMDKRCNETYKKGFMDMTAEQRTEFLTVLDKEQREYQKTVVEPKLKEIRDAKMSGSAAGQPNKDNNAAATATTAEPADPVPHYFRMIKQHTMLGFFTSKVGATEVLRYVEVPGKYEGCIDYKKGDRAWAT